MHEFLNKWFLTRLCLALFHFLLFEKCIRILWKCKTLKGENICFHEKSDAWISKQVVSNQTMFGIVPFSIVWEMHQNSVEMQNLQGRKHLFPWEFWCMNFKTSGILPGNIWHCSIFYCLRNVSEFCGNAKPSREKAFVSMRNLMHEFQNNWFLTMQHLA